VRDLREDLSGAGWDSGDVAARGEDGGRGKGLERAAKKEKVKRAESQKHGKSKNRKVKRTESQKPKSQKNGKSKTEKSKERV
jgi:hypothetical protein